VSFAVVRRSSPWLVAAVGALAVLLAPGVAAAEGAGYGGNADALTVRWQDQSGNRTADGASLAVYAVGFRAGSAVAVRVGSAAERTVTTDASGAVRILLVSSVAAAHAPAAAPEGTVVLPLDTSSVDRLSAGTSVQAVGRTPSNSTRALVGAVPPPPAGNGPQDLVLWAFVAAALLALGGFAWRAGPLGLVLARVRPNQWVRPNQRVRSNHRGRPNHRGRHRPG
jgi:hypothetical protein